jgi:TrmH family RNA methyltransferase
MLKISSRENQRIKQARKVRDSLIEDKIFVEGLRLAEEALRSNLKISDVFFTESFSQTERGQALFQKVENLQPTEISEKVLDSLSDTKNSQGIIIICEKPATGKATMEAALQSDLREYPLVVLLHQINNPANQGAILRTCEAVGVTGVILTENSAAVFSPKALRGAMGATFRLPIWANADFFEVINWAKGENLTSVCADVNAKKSYLEIDWKKSRLLVFGSEAHGLTHEEREAIDESLIIPMENKVESLNLAVSSGVILFEAKRQRR